MSDVDAAHLRLLEAILFASAEALTERELAERLPDEADVEELLRELQAHYGERGVHLVKAGRSWAFRTAPDLAALFTKETEVTRRLSRAAVETLSAIAYHQPVTRPEIEEIRGVGLSKGTLDVLFEAGWVRPKGRRRTPGRPVTWGTTDEFLDNFGLERLGDLPGMDELKAAGLLDARPALDAYPMPGGSAANTDAEDGAAEEELEADEQPEPLEPGGDG
jgi:segregation and condensation protein B